MIKVKNVKIEEAIMAFQYMLSKNIIYADIVIENESTVYFLASKLPSKDEIIGNRIIESINFDENEEEE